MGSSISRCRRECDLPKLDEIIAPKSIDRPPALIDIIPDDVLRIVFGYIDWRQWKHISATCKRWHGAVNRLAKMLVTGSTDLMFLYSPIAAKFHRMKPTTGDIIAAGKIIPVSCDSTSLRIAVTRWVGHPCPDVFGCDEKTAIETLDGIRAWHRDVEIKLPPAGKLVVRVLDKCRPRNARVIIDQLILLSAFNGRPSGCFLPAAIHKWQRSVGKSGLAIQLYRLLRSGSPIDGKITFELMLAGCYFASLDRFDCAVELLSRPERDLVLIGIMASHKPNHVPKNIRNIRPYHAATAEYIARRGQRFVDLSTQSDPEIVALSTIR